MSNFRVGQKVVCVDDTPPPWSDRRLNTGDVYTITWINPNTGGFRLAEASAEPAISFKRSRFRPVVEPKRKTTIEQFRKLLVTNKEPVKVGGNP